MAMIFVLNYCVKDKDSDSDSVSYAAILADSHARRHIVLLCRLEKAMS